MIIEYENFSVKTIAKRSFLAIMGVSQGEEKRPDGGYGMGAA